MRCYKKSLKHDIAGKQQTSSLVISGGFIFRQIKIFTDSKGVGQATSTVLTKSVLSSILDNTSVAMQTKPLANMLAKLLANMWAKPLVNTQAKSRASEHVDPVTS